FQWFVGPGVYLLMRNKRRDEDEISRTCLSHILELFAPAHPGTPFYNIDHAFQLAVMMGSRFGVWMNIDGACPNLAGARARIVDRGGSDHTGSLRRIGIKAGPWYDLDSVVSPI